jgi:hypothetical protein
MRVTMKSEKSPQHTHLRAGFLTLSVAAFHLLSASTCLLATSSEAHATGWQLIELNEARLYWQHFIDEGRDELIFPRVHREALNLSVDMDVLSFFYWDNTVLSVTDESQFRGVGLHSKVGMRLTPWLSVQYDHTSKHVLDGQHSSLPSFPVYDSIGVLIQLYRSKSDRRSVIE